MSDLASITSDTPWARLQELTGQRVRLEGEYKKVRVSKRRDTKPPDLTTGGTASVGGIMLGVYHDVGGQREVEEIQRFHGKQVVVVATLMGSTPELYSDDGIPMATMTGPCVISIESIELA